MQTCRSPVGARERRVTRAASAAEPGRPPAEASHSEPDATLRASAETALGVKTLATEAGATALGGHGPSGSGASSDVSDGSASDFEAYRKKKRKRKLQKQKRKGSEEGTGEATGSQLPQKDGASETSAKPPPEELPKTPEVEVEAEGDGDPVGDLEDQFLAILASFANKVDNLVPQSSERITVSDRKEVRAACQQVLLSGGQLVGLVKAWKNQMRGAVRRRKELEKVSDTESVEVARSIAVEPVRKPTFSQVASRANRVAVVVRSKGVAATSAETLKKLQEKVDVRGEGIEVSGIRQKASGAVVVEVEGKRAADRFLEVASQEASLDVQEARKQLPLVICRGLPSTIKEADVIDSLERQNKRLSSFRGRFRQVIREKSRLPSRNGVASVVFEVTSDFRKLLLSENVAIGWGKYAFGDFVQVIRCFRCQGYGHRQGACTARPTCALCARDDHDTRDCRRRDAPRRCIACVRSNRAGKGPVDDRHEAMSPRCPTTERMRGYLRSRIL